MTRPNMRTLQMQNTIDRQKARLAEAVRLLSRAKSEIFLASYGSPDLVAEIESFLGSEEAARTATEPE